MESIRVSPYPLPSCRPFLDRLSPAAGQQLTLNSRSVRYPAGSVPFFRGDPLRSALLQSGLARVFVSSDQGRQATVRYVHRGELMGATFVEDEAFPASVQMVAESSVEFLDPEHFNNLVHAKVDVACALAGELAARYLHAIQSATVLIFGSPLQKIAHDLLDRACREQLASGRLLVGASHQELADSINSSREVVSRAMSELRRRRLIASTTRQTTVLDPEGLAHVAWRDVT